MGFSFKRATTYHSDLALFRRLGLKPFEIDHSVKTFVGECKLTNWEGEVVKIWVTCYPEMFWHFEIITGYSDPIKIDTGSGALSDFWCSVEKIATGMIVVTR